MIYCDLTIDSSLVWAGTPCQAGVEMNAEPYFGFLGSLYFIDLNGISDPMWQGLGTQYQLVYIPSDGTPAIYIPLSAEPNQQVSIGLMNQNCLLSLYDRSTL